MTSSTQSIVASVRGSTCTQDYVWLPLFVEAALLAKEGRADSAAEARKAREKLYENVRSAVALIDKSMPRSLSFDDVCGQFIGGSLCVMPSTDFLPCLPEQRLRATSQKKTQLWYQRLDWRDV